MPQHITRVKFEWQGIIYPADFSPTYYNKTFDTHTEGILKSILNDTGYSTIKAHLALKTLAVCSGLSEYGKNNISYAAGMGSFYRLVAFYTDCPCEEDDWQEPRLMKACESCSLCREACPTGSISADRFLIHAENCLGFLNESNPDFPYWVRKQPDYSSAFIGCMLCQFACPVNKPYSDKTTDGPLFSEEETGLLLNKTPLEKLSTDTRQKLDNPGATFYALITSNLKALIEKQK